MNITWGDIDSNLKVLEKSLTDLPPGTDLLVLPESFSTGFFIPENIDDSFKRLLLRNKDEVLLRISFLSRKHNVAIAGSVFWEEENQFFNRGFFIEPTGDQYFSDKRHLFSMVGEDRLFKNGDQRMNVRYRGWNISLIICYDLRFPVWCRNIKNEYDLLLVVANWPLVRINAWEKLLAARAIENEAFVAGVNCKGVDFNNFEYDGTSLICDFKGYSVGAVAGPFIHAELSKEKLLRFREKFPAWKDADKFSWI